MKPPGGVYPWIVVGQVTLNPGRPTIWLFELQCGHAWVPGIQVGWVCETCTVVSLKQIDVPFKQYGLNPDSEQITANPAVTINSSLLSQETEHDNPELPPDDEPPLDDEELEPDELDDDELLELEDELLDDDDPPEVPDVPDVPLELPPEDDPPDELLDDELLEPEEEPEDDDPDEAELDDELLLEEDTAWHMPIPPLHPPPETVHPASPLTPPAQHTVPVWQT